MQMNVVEVIVQPDRVVHVPVVTQVKLPVKGRSSSYTLGLIAANF